MTKIIQLILLSVALGAKGADRPSRFVPVPIAPAPKVATPAPVPKTCVYATDTSKGGALALAKEKLPPDAKITETRYSAPARKFDKSNRVNNLWHCTIFYQK